jgi:hypothetical protein
MKKGIIVLLIAVLVAGFAFAGIEGSARIAFDVDLDEQEFGFGNFAAGKYSFEFTYDTLPAGTDAHETDLWAEIAAEGSVKLETKEVDPADSYDDGGEVSVSSLSKIEWKNTDKAKITAKLKITKANIHIGEWTFGILNAGAAVDYATTYYTYKAADGKYYPYDSVGGEARVVPGFTVSYKGWRGGLGLWGSWGDKLTVDIFAHGETKEFKFGENEEFALQAGAYVHYYNDKPLLGEYPQNVGGAAKVTYATDALSADAAVDLQMVLASEKEFRFEADANATYKFNDKGSAGLNIYATEGALAKDGSKDNYQNAQQIKLDAKLWAKYDFDFDGTTLATEASVDVRDTLVDGRSFTVSAKETLTILDGKLALAFTEKYGALTKKLNGDVFFKATGFDFSAKATYTADKFEAYVSVDSFAIAKVTVMDESLSAMVINASCGVTSDKIIENAEIGLTYSGFGFYKIEDSIFTKGVIEAYATIAF